MKSNVRLNSIRFLSWLSAAAIVSMLANLGTGFVLVKLFAGLDFCMELTILSAAIAVIICFTGCFCLGVSWISNRHIMTGYQHSCMSAFTGGLAGITAGGLLYLVGAMTIGGLL